MVRVYLEPGLDLEMVNTVLVFLERGVSGSSGRDGFQRAAVVSRDDSDLPFSIY